MSRAPVLEVGHRDVDGMGYSGAAGVLRMF